MFGFGSDVFYFMYRVLRVFMLEKARVKKRALCLEWKERFMMVLSSCQSSFHSLRLGPEKNLVLHK